ncbi:MAG: transrane protein [Thermoleophilia bacterium]|nr:transrane protein [Thermoleophilia bacterium]
MGAAAMKGTGSTQASTGVTALGGGGGGGGGAGDLASVLANLAAAVKSLAAVVANMGGNKVAGVEGGPATGGQYVAPVVLAPVATTKSEDSDFEARVLQLINQERAKYGVGALTYNASLDRAAEGHAGQMATVHAMAHDGIGDGDPGERIRAQGFGNAWGENVAVGQTSPEQVVAEWMASPGHKRNILDPNFRQSGISQLVDSTGRVYWAQEFGA